MRLAGWGVVLAGAAATAALTWVIGWWGVLVAASAIGFAFAGEGGAPWRAALAAMLAWAALLAVDAAAGPLGVVVRTLGGVLRVPGVVAIALTLVFPGLLAWSAATVAAALRQRAGRSA